MTSVVQGIEFHGYRDCVRMENGRARVVLGPGCGGRVLEYSWGGVSALKLDPAQAGWRWQGPGGPEIDPWGGRFDVGPEHVLPPRPAIWLGPWTAQPAPGGGVRMESGLDPGTGLRLSRSFELAPSSHLRCVQTITNASGEVRACCHWGRTMAPGGGIVIVPTTPGSRFPRGYVQYRTAEPLLDWAPDDPNVRARDGFLEVVGPLRHPKLGFDSAAGWMAYLLPSGLLFAKRYPVYPDRVYGELSAFTLAIWLHEDKDCELEPIGPLERLAPGGSASFTEDWWLLPHAFPARRDGLDLEAVAARVAREAADR